MNMYYQTWYMQYLDRKYILPPKLIVLPTCKKKYFSYTLNESATNLKYVFHSLLK